MHDIKNLKHHVAIHPFPDRATEIQYFKSWLPGFGKQYIYFHALFNLEHNKDICDSDTFLEWGNRGEISAGEKGDGGVG